MKMRKAAIFFSVVILSGLGAVAAKSAPRPADQPRTMDEVIDRVITNENRGNPQIKQYSLRAKTYTRNSKPDKALGDMPAGNKSSRGRAGSSHGVPLLAVTAANGAA